MTMKKSISALFAALLMLLTNQAVFAALPEISQGEENVAGVGKVKYTSTKVFTTELDGQPVMMQIIYMITTKNQPTFTFDIYDNGSQIYNNFDSFNTQMRSQLGQVRVDGRRLFDIYAYGDPDGTWGTSQNASISGGLFDMVQKINDMVDGKTVPAINVILPLGLMDHCNYDWNNKNHWKDFQKVLTSGTINSLEYVFNIPGTYDKTIKVKLPLNSDIILTMNRLVEEYNKKKK